MPANIWDEIRLRLQQKVNRLSYDTWFRPTAFVADDGRAVTVRVPNRLCRDWIAKHYSGVIVEALEEVNRSDTLINFIPRDADTDALAVASPNAGFHSIEERVDRVQHELGVIRRDVDLILSKLSST